MSPASFKRTLADALTVSRFFAAALVMTALTFPIPAAEPTALAAFLFGSLTDFWDGRLARAAGGHSPFGRVVDPLADKALTLSAFFGLAARHLIPAWSVGLILARDALVTWKRSRISAGAERAGARESGKWKTFLQMVFLVGTLGYLAFRGDPSPESIQGAVFEWGAVAIAALTVWSGLRFLLRS